VLIVSKGILLVKLSKEIFLVESEMSSLSTSTILIVIFDKFIKYEFKRTI
jgi:hypothetical protein